MNNTFFTNCSTLLLNEGFLPFKPTDSEDINFFIKEKGGICYIVSPIYLGDNQNDVDMSISEDKIKSLLHNSKFYKVFFIKLFIHNKYSETFANLSSEFFPDDDFVKIIWDIDILAKKIIPRANNPDKIIGLSDKLQSLLNTNGIVIPDISHKDYVISPIPILTFGLIIILIIIFALTQQNKNDIIIKFATVPLLLETGEWYRIFTSVFLHSDIQHLLSNILSLYIFGTRLERYMGKRLFIITFIVGSISSSIFSIISDIVSNPITTPVYSIGASGAIFALGGAILYFSKIRNIKLDGLDFHFLLMLTLISILIGFSLQNIDNAGHIGGFISGLIVCSIFCNILQKNKISKT